MNQSISPKLTKGYRELTKLTKLTKLRKSLQSSQRDGESASGREINAQHFQWWQAIFVNVLKKN